MLHQPKIVLHDHLDGGVRSATIIELATAAGVPLPANDPDELGKWLTITPGMELARAWKRFELVIASLQTAAGLRRVAREAVEDLAAEGVIYAELRFAPLNHLAGGLNPDEVMAAVTAGLAAGEQATSCIARTIVCGIRENSPAESVAAAHLAVSWKDRGVVGFDLAGNEFDFGAELHRDAFEVANRGGLGITVHAGEMAGPESIANALEAAHPDRIGHGMHLIDDCLVEEGRIVGMGPVAGMVRDSGIVLEVCVTSNSCLGTPVPGHPVRMFYEAGFPVTVNPDDRAITTTTVEGEYQLWRSVHGFSDDDFRVVNLAAARAAFCDPPTRRRLEAAVTAGWATPWVS
jgi:adenosine deaminase